LSQAPPKAGQAAVLSLHRRVKFLVLLVQLPPHNKEFHTELDIAQRRIKLLAFFAVSNLVENLSRRITYIIFAK